MISIVENDAIKFGLEYNFNNMVALRGGYVYTNKAESENVMYTFTLGAGFQYNRTVSQNAGKSKIHKWFSFGCLGWN